jgi:chromatin remodeling complex protein RSC6
MTTGTPAFGGYTVSFAGQTTTLEALFGSEPLTPPEMTKMLWTFIRERGLSGKAT